MSFKEIVYIGKINDEEYYFDVADEFGCWNFISVIPRTENDLREQQRDTDIEDFYDIGSLPRQYINEDAFAEDMEENWYEHADVLDEYDVDDETYYLCNQSSHELTEYFTEKGIVDYENYVEHFEETGLTEKQFNELIQLINYYKLDNNIDEKDLLKWAETCKKFPYDKKTRGEKYGK